MAVILVIDDSNLARASVRKLLAPEGHEILEATKGEEGLEMISSHSPDCILLDILMPGVSGMDILSRLRSERSRIPVIVVTADIQESVREKCLELGAFAVINKPLLLQTLSGTIMEALKGKTR
jgi:CheY-like chemotaxis protein